MKPEQDKDEKVRQLCESLKQGVTDMIASGKFKQWLDFQAKFHKYSFHNSMLIMIQRPSASKVAGLHQWNDRFGRSVCKGEKGIAIFAPILVRKPPEDGRQTDKSTWPQVLVGFKVVRVFDVAQTEGKPLPVIAEQVKGDSEEADQIAAGLLAYAREKSIRVTTEELNGPDGSFYPRDHLIKIQAGLPGNHRAITFTHEMAYALLWERYDDPAKVSRQQKECEAEGVAYVVCKHFGLPVETHPFEYIATFTWDNPETLIAAGLRIQQTATRLIEVLSKTARESRVA